MVSTGDHKTVEAEYKLLPSLVFLDLLLFYPFFTRIA